MARLVAVSLEMVLVMVELGSNSEQSLSVEGMREIIFLVEEAPEGGYTARALGESIFTEAETLEELRAHLRDAVRCHFDDEAAPSILRLHFVREEVLAAQAQPQHQ